ncbi:MULTISPECIES: class 1b ribonucleoside-diphosphate reductase subunit beta [Heyndrickxia]|jgi:ribonucleoside-diphosphate reductase beta chain|uniref:Ribonucleoside-diphosphate reductase subunit beta n=1 Tax=Heyndrickxia oleronia TaxID=38875 RepID=A0A8E2IGE0_9BACI|nr:class 1b ribonucleoside-diphosphate reductase subunit beta [Heyndrickxia oleronia]NYV65678.1 class 1b ribonucleoside-diphosphate reductase subunit beta [Bacillus sp. Gen3]MBU5211580.1 class 1b ribonucleoside-diphosphate reductase subunit beta [Heyndrickxia oleronia]MCI1589034.1 class 1b ribonucleoside-diphosphate reductase subunit beta [Heyndrickxia oleronia]MCI1611874.1 class 1b ribonucleoside-diphosphate reductase subunit beta [Heyndrickxia oleronia]MCI1743119.1 class 1b ribonucleoside-di
MSKEWDYYEAINWNNIEDMLDKITYEKLTEQFWLSTRMPVSKDKSDWTKLPDPEKRLVEKVFGGLTMLDTLQSENGIDALRKDAKTQHEIAVLNNIQFMESEHARSYSSIFSTLNTKKEIDDIFRWARENDLLQNKARIIDEIYKNGTPLEKKVASVFLESFLFYSGFYTPLYYLGRAKLINVAEVIKLIIRDESAHGAYIGYKFKIGFDQLSDTEKEEIKSWTYSLLYQLYENEVKYTEALYDEVGWTEDVKVFLRYNANKALMNLGLSPLFPDSADDVNPIVMNGLSTGTTNHDFFSTVGNGYLLSVVEDMKESDYNY